MMIDATLVRFLAIDMEVLVLRFAPDDWEEPQEKLWLLVGWR